MALKIVLLALLVYCAASEAQSQGDDTFFPLDYDVTVLEGDGATCPNDQQLQEETEQIITIDVRSLLRDTVVPFIAQCPCISGGRTRIANLDMSDPNQQCPPQWRQRNNPVRTCRRKDSKKSACDSVTFPVNGTTYSRVCGRVRAYQVGRTDAFLAFNRNNITSIESYYVDGVSITYGRRPREHVWTFAAARNEKWRGTLPQVCRCTNINNPNAANIQIPPFVGNDYFCDTGAATDTSTIQFLRNDPLWDGKGCGPTSTCCELNNPPWFCKQLPAPTSDDIEVRICLFDINGFEDIAIEQIELYIS